MVSRLQFPLVVLVAVLGMSSYWNFTIQHRFLPASATRTTITGTSSNNTNSIYLANAEDIQFVKCGYTKCFLTLMATYEDDDDEELQVGYIIAQDNRTWRGDLASGFDKAWTIAAQIRKRYHVSSLLLGPAEYVWKQDAFVDRINEKVASMNYPDGKSYNFSSHAPFIVEKSYVVPEPNLFWHYRNKQAKRTSSYLEFIQTHVQDIDLFAQNLFPDLEAAKQMLELYPCLCADFQFLLDYKGRIHHLDLDRCFDEDESSNQPPVAYPPHTKQQIMQFLETLTEKHKMAIMEAKLAL